jgi:hypothetical protein
MEIGEIVWWQGRLFRVRGITPMSQADGIAEIEELETGEWWRAPIKELEPRPGPSRQGGVVYPFRPPGVRP